MGEKHRQRSGRLANLGHLAVKWVQELWRNLAPAVPHLEDGPPLLTAIGEGKAVTITTSTALTRRRAWWLCMTRNCWHAGGKALDRHRGA